MRVKLYISTLLLLSVSLLSRAGNGPKICWLETYHDFGAFDESVGFATTTFEAVNTGDEPLIILSARANCGCTTPRYTLESIAPGDTARLSVSYDAKGRPGRFEKKVYVTSNAEKNSVLTIAGTVIGASNSLKGRYPVDGGDIRLSSSVIPFGQIKKGSSATSMLRGYNSSSDTIHPTISEVPSYLKFSISPQSVPPGEQFAISAVANTSDYPIWGLTADSVKIHSSASPDKETGISLSTVMIVEEDFSKLTAKERENAPIAVLSSDFFDMDKLGWDNEAVKITGKITNNGKNPLEIHRFYSPDRAVSVKIKKDKIKGGKSEDFTIIVNQKEMNPGEPLNARITLITNDPTSPTKIIRVVGERR